jgi:hypothetical protein
MDTTNGVYTRYSSGLLSAQCKVALANGQNLQANAGIDAEQVRDLVQNRAVHDLLPNPKKAHMPINCHIPMLDTQGNQYLYLPGQQIRPSQLYWNAFTGAAAFY